MGMMGRLTLSAVVGFVVIGVVSAHAGNNADGPGLPASGADTHAPSSPAARHTPDGDSATSDARAGRDRH
jgi:hypothetical protein